MAGNAGPVIPPAAPRPAKPELLIRPTKGVLDVSPARAGWEFVGFSALRLAAGKRHRNEHADRESCIVVLGGRCDIRVGDTEWKDVGGRAT
ncbi:MAG TPA: 5-deoxy-glucuronate isomerase, partial [Candidatus Limnocylindria bacterium]